MNMTNALVPDMLPCPFCGSNKGQVLQFRSRARSGYRARCTGCGVTQGHPKVYSGTRAAIETWNKRVSSADQESFLNGVMLALQVLNSAGEGGGSSYNELVRSAGKENLIELATKYGWIELCGLHRLVEES